MNIEEYRDYCLAKKGVSEEFPFDDKVLVFKVMGKMFALTNVDDFQSINLKCDPERAIQLRQEFDGVVGGYHMSKKHWNTVSTDGSILDSHLYQWIDDSYNLIVDKLTKKQREELKML